ncbi:MAG: helix-turn-helix domain-containing protein [Hominilimicola sp.]
MKKAMKTNKIVSHEEFGFRLRQLRKEKNLSQGELAEKLRVSRSSVANWENGIRFPDCLSVKQLAVIFGVSVDYLYGLSSHRYNINIPDYLELDLTKLNDAGMGMLYDYYKLLIGSETYGADTEKNA